MEVQNTSILSANVRLSNQSIVDARRERMGSLDIQRGIVLLLMAFCHSREFGIDDYSNMDWDVAPNWMGDSLLDLIQQAFMSMIAAGGFFMLLGVGVTFFYYTRQQHGWTLGKICRYLMLRGLLFIAIQLTVLQFFESMVNKKIFFYAGVLMSLGFDLIFAAIIVYYSHKLRNVYLLPIVIMVGLCVSFQLMINHIQLTQQTPSLLAFLLVTCGHYHIGHFEISVNFTPIPWLPVVLFGVLLGELLYKNQERGFKIIGLCAVGCLIAWFSLRYLYLNGMTAFGDYKQVGDKAALTWASYFCMSKYPPSISFFLWTCGINLASLYLVQLVEKHSARLLTLLEPIKLLGQTALIFFIFHWYIYYGLSLVINEPFTSTLGITFFWFIGLLIAYPICQAFRDFRLRQTKASVWRML